MRRFVASLTAVLLLVSGAAAARPPGPVVHEDADDTAGPLDVLSVTRTSAKVRGERVFRHRIHFQERWADDEVQATFLVSAFGFEVPSWCAEDDCTGDWDGRIYEDDEGVLRAEMWALSNCDDCQAWAVPVVEEDDGDVVLTLPKSLFYGGADYYEMRLETHFENTLRANAEVDCRVPVCHDYVPDAEDEWMRFSLR